MKKVIISVLAVFSIHYLLFPDRAQADVAMPIYPFLWVASPLILLLETAAFLLLARKVYKIDIKLSKIILIVLVSNMISALLGAFMGFNIAISKGRNMVILGILFFVSWVVEGAIYIPFLPKVSIHKSFVICLVANLAGYSILFAPVGLIPVSSRSKAVDRAVRHALANLETVRASLAQYAADQDDACYPETAQIGDNFSKLEATLRGYGLPRERSPTGFSWRSIEHWLYDDLGSGPWSRWSSFEYTRDGSDCTLYTLAVEVADGHKTVFKAMPAGVCCDDIAASGPNCLWYRIFLKCSVLLRAVEPLIAALKDEDELVRREAVLALAEMGDRRAVEPLMVALRDENPEVRRNAVQALGKLQDSRAVEPLIAALKDEKPEIGQSAAFALGEIKDRRAVAPLVDSLKSEDMLVRLESAEALGEIRDPRAVQALISALGDGHDSVQRAAIDALGKITGKYFGRDPERWQNWWEQNREQFESRR